MHTKTLDMIIHRESKKVDRLKLQTSEVKSIIDQTVKNLGNFKDKVKEDDVILIHNTKNIKFAQEKLHRQKLFQTSVLDRKLKLQTSVEQQV